MKTSWVIFSFWERIYFENLLIYAFSQRLLCLRRQMTKDSGIYIVLISPSVRLNKSYSVMALVNLSPVTYMKYNNFFMRVQLRKSVSSPSCLYTWGNGVGKESQNKTLAWDSESFNSLVMFLNFFLV